MAAKGKFLQRFGVGARAGAVAGCGLALMSMPVLAQFGGFGGSRGVKGAYDTRVGDAYAEGGQSSFAFGFGEGADVRGATASGTVSVDAISLWLWSRRYAS